jgi:uncharacterized protein
VAGRYPIPGVYREDIYVRSAAPLPTGVPGFVGLATMTDARGKPTREPIVLHRAEDLSRQCAPLAQSYLADVVAGFFMNGGTRCYVVGTPETGAHAVAELTDAIGRLAPLSDLDLVAVPDVATLPDDDALKVQLEAVKHCGLQGNRFAILDAPAALDPAHALADGSSGLTARRLALVRGTEAANAALYYPWIKVAAASKIPGMTEIRTVPPCGHVAGIFARSDGRVGVFKAPANEVLLGVVDLEFPIDAETQAALNPVGINCLRALPGRGLRVWGARTLSTEASWLYVNVRRLVLTLARWIDRNMGWVPFEPNTPRLWNRIQRELNAYLGQLWQAGALKGASAEEAFFVKCDSETNPPGEREKGRVSTDVGVAPALPAEFVVVRIVHRPGAAQLS